MTRPPLGPGAVLLLSLGCVEARAKRQGREPTPDEYRALIIDWSAKAPAYFVIRRPSRARAVIAWFFEKLVP